MLLPERDSVNDFLCRLKAIVRFLGHHLFHDGLQRDGDIGTLDQDRRCGPGLVCHQPLCQRTAVEGRVPRQQEIEGTPETVDIGATVDLVAVDRLFRRDVVGGAQDFFVVLHRQ